MAACCLNSAAGKKSSGRYVGRTVRLGILSEDTATPLRESVELGSVYGVALGTLFVFLVVGGLFALDLPAYIQKRREASDE